jgi:hypothetical protein
MNNEKHKGDQFLKSLLKHSRTETLPGDFTDSVMERISSEVKHEQAYNKPLISLKGWILIGAGFVVLGYFLFFFDWTLLGFNLSPEKINVKDYTMMVNSFKNISERLSNFIAFFTNSKIPLVILIGGVSLVFIDKVIRKFSLRKYFTF